MVSLLDQFVERQLLYTVPYATLEMCVPTFDGMGRSHPLAT